MFGWTPSRSPSRQRAKGPPHPEPYETRARTHRVLGQSRQDEIDLMRELQLLDLTIPPWVN
jgi:hypothetical protein